MRLRRNGTFAGDLKRHLDLLDAGKTKSPYFNLYRRYYNAYIPENEDKHTLPWAPSVVFKKGFRQIYTQNSYLSRPGNWLVLQFRDTKKALALFQWLLTVIPTERLGENVPLPRIRVAERQIVRLENILEASWTIPLSTLQKVYHELVELKRKHPELFTGERVYLWERLAFAFNSYSQIQLAEKCLRIQAELQPTKSDAFLNLGVFLTDYGYYESAVSVYQEGLRRTPNCEFLNYNLASLARTLPGKRAV